MQRFYKDVSVGPAEAGGFVVLLDGRPVRTPGKSVLIARSRALADALAREWEAQEKSIKPESMPLTQLATTATDRAAQRADIAATALAYLETDLLCYRAALPDTLVAAQETLWNPWLDWFAGRFGARLATTQHLAPVAQPEAAIKATRGTVAAMDPDVFTVFQAATAATGSAVLGLALALGALDAETAFEAALCEELHYEREHDLTRHGLDPIEEKRRAALLRDLRAAADYLKATTI
ncbi:MAG: hypothetical protein H6865_01750 [Rhodospirillales bacterium]|nr:hypothetical protein [Alphaproteobacteria bacterium]MCB9986343.1 hypothetical protein [Rhodospirillales bacterium]USO07107.1 MAG: hypothetical protein H6866_06635 [Rhodospirillales bacterium]